MEGLFPLDGSRRLGGDVVDAAVDALDLVDNAVGNSGKKVVGESVPIGSHVIGSLDTANSSGLCINPFGSSQNIKISKYQNIKISKIQYQEKGILLVHKYDRLP